MNMAIADRARLWRLPLNFLRSFSSSSASPSSTSNTVASKKKPKRGTKKNLFEVSQFLPNWGLGYHMAKTHWTNVSYEITKINLYKDGRHGKAWALLTRTVYLLMIRRKLAGFISVAGRTFQSKDSRSRNNFLGWHLNLSSYSMQVCIYLHWLLWSAS